jgi:serine/alanine adding enzyme
MIDIYFKSSYGKLYEPIEKGVCNVFEFNCSLGKVRHMFIMREVPFRTGGKTYFDLVTPYGYGGPVIIECENKHKKQQLVDEFIKAFQNYCFDNNIVSEFVRFHPILRNAEDFKSAYDVVYIRNTVGTNLAAYDDPVQCEFSKSCRKNINKALASGVGYRITVDPQSMTVFKKIYYSTMDRNSAGDYYYFGDAYFDGCLELLGENLILVEAIYKAQTIAMSMCFVYGKTIHVHLSGTLNEFLYLSPAYVLRYAISLWGKENGYKMIHHGGGRSNAQDDSLYLFKKRFGKNTEFEFYIGKKIWNRDMYYELCKLSYTDPKAEFFPAYRV